MIFAVALALALLAQVAQAPPPGADEEAIRLAVQQYYEAQAQRDPDKTLAFWSASANPRPAREAFVAVFGEPAEDSFSVDIRAIDMKGAEARVRVLASRTRLIMRNGVPVTQRANIFNSQLWKKEATGWKLLRDGPFAEEIADDLIAAAAADRPALFEKHRADLVQARLAISQRATMAITLGRNYPQGKALFELALEVSRAANDRRGEANSLHNIAQASFFLRDYPAATDAYEKELAVGRETADDDASAAALFGLATVAYTRAEYTSALGLYRDALVIYEKRDDGSAIGRAVVSIGNVQYLQAEYDAAIASYRRGLDAMLAGGDLQGASFARSGLARVFAAQGDLAAALEMYGQVLGDARAAAASDPRQKNSVAQCLESIGEIYYRLGNTDQARARFEEARTLSEGDIPGIGRISANLGLTELVAGRFDAALAAYTESRARYEQAKQPDGVARAWVGIGFSHGAREKFPEAVEAYRTAIRIFDEQKLPEDAARAWLGLSLAQSGAGDHEAGLVSARKVRDTAAAVKSEDLAWRAAVRAGEALRKLKRLGESRAEFARAIENIDRLAEAAPVNPEARTALDDSASAWSGLALTLAASGDARGALDTIEARRAHARRVQLAPFQRDVARGMSPDERADEQGIVRELISTRAQLRAEANARRSDQTRRDRLQQQLATLTARRTEQQSKLYARLPELQQWRALSAPAFDLDATLTAAGALVIEYLAVDEELLVVTAAHGDSGPEVSATILPFKRREIAEQIAKAAQPAVLADPAAWREQALPLAAALVTPIESRLEGNSRCVVIPDDLLWKVPFEALPSKDRALGMRTTISYATSLTTLSLQQKAAAAFSPHDGITAVMFAAPVIPDALRAQLSLAHSGWKEPDGEMTLQAVTDMSREYGDAGVVRATADATEAAARAALVNADVLQFGGPLQISGATPLFSMLVLGGDASAADNDGRWEVREWFSGTSHARVLVMSDGSAFGSAGIGGAMDTIAWAAAALGVPSLVLARWPADGFSSETLLREFHAALAKGIPPADAWTGAATVAREKGSAPAQWAGLRLIGAGR